MTKRWVSPLGAAVATFTAMSCIGVSAAVSLSTSVGATFLTRDTTLRPLLAIVLAVTVVGSALTYWRRRRIWPLVLSAAAAVWVYGFVYVIHGSHHDHMADHMRAAFSGGRLAAIWVGLAVLVGSQLADVLGSRLVRRSSP